MIAVVLADLVVNLRLLLTFNSYPTFANFIVPYTLTQYSTTLPGPWSPFQYLGVPSTNVWLSDVGFVFTTGPLWAFSSVLGPVAGAKLYALGSVIVLGGSFLLACRAFVADPRAQLVAALFILLGPFQLQLYAQGDFEQFIAWALVFLSVYALERAIAVPRRRWLWFPLSLWALALSCYVAEFLLLGTVLYLVCLGVFARPAKPLVPAVRRLIGTLARPALLLPSLLAPLLVTAVYGSINIGPGSTLALPVSTFASYSATPLAVFFLQGYVHQPGGYLGYSLVASVSPSVALAWTVLTIALVTAIWLGYLFVRDSRILALFGVAVAAALFGAGPAGPLDSLTVYLYLHLPGYAALNTSYYWDWVLVVPALALALGLVVQGILARPPWSFAPGPPAPPLKSRPEYRTAAPPRRGVRISVSVFVALIVLVVAIPFAVQAQYDPTDGMHQIEYPSDYAEVAPLLEKLVGDSYAGVALFNPDVNWFLGNSSSPLTNAFVYYPVVRTPGLPFYLAPPVQANYYLYWVYEEFYSNSTRYLGELLSLVGVEYLVVFYNTQAASFYPYFLPASIGQNASKLLVYQEGITLVSTSESFAVYRNDYYQGVAAVANGLSLVAGDYRTLNALAYAGVNLADQAFVYPNDLTPSTCPEVLQRLDRVYAASANLLLGLALSCHAVSTANPVEFIQGGTSGWASDQQDIGISIADQWTGPMAVTSAGSASLSVGLSTAGCGQGCGIWVPVMFSGAAGSMTFGWLGQSYTLATDRGYDGLNNSVLWVDLPFAAPAGSSGALTVTSSFGTNAVGTIVLTDASAATPAGARADLNATLASLPVACLVPASTLARVGPSRGATSSEYYQTTNNGDPNGSGIYLNATAGGPLASINLTLPRPGASGWLTALVGVPGDAVFVTAYGEQREVAGFGAGTPRSAPSAWTTLNVFLNGTANPTSDMVSIQLLNGTAWLAQLAFFPSADVAPVTPAPPGVALALAAVHTTALAANLTVALVGSGPGSTELVGSAELTPAPTGRIYATLNFSEPLAESSAMAIQFNVTPGLQVSLNGLDFGGDSAGGSVIYAPTLYNGGLTGPSPNYTVTLRAFGQPTLYRPNANFAMTFTTVNFSGASDVSDLNRSASVSVTSNSAGYHVSSSEGASLLVVRVSYFPGLATTPGSASLTPAMGGLATLLWNPGDGRTVAVGLDAATYLGVGLGVAAVATALAIGVEVLMIRRGPKTPPAPK